MILRVWEVILRSEGSFLRPGGYQGTPAGPEWGFFEPQWLRSEAWSGQSGSEWSSKWPKWLRAYVLRRFSMFFDVFCPFLTSWRPGRGPTRSAAKFRTKRRAWQLPISFVTSNGGRDTQNMVTLFRPTSRFSTFFEKVDPVCLLRPNRSVENTPMLIL